MRGCVSLESGIVADNGQRATDIRGVLRGPRGPKNQISSELLHSPDILIMILRWKNQSSEHQEGEVLLHSRSLMDIHQPLTISTRKCKKELLGAQ